MKLYLMQHALAYQAGEDPERQLSPAGVAQAKAAARGIKRLGLGFDLIITSPKRRAHQTAALLAETVRFPYSDILTTETVLPDQPPQALLDLLQQERLDSRILVVGHMPQLANLARVLMQGGELLFQNAGLSCFDLDKGNSARLEFHLTAEQLAHFNDNRKF
ncbi:MAG: phosphohistidine phosphatase SixA [Desulfuromonadales bacterium]